MSTVPLSVKEARVVRDRPAENLDRLLAVAQDEISKAVVGQGDAVESMLIALFARGHVLLEGPPGTAKTLLAQAMARAVGGHFRRVQFTPDTGAAELTGEYVKRGMEHVFEKGALFTNVLLADEINRGHAQTQASLLEAMQERHVSIGGRVHWLDSPFFVIATQNPHEQEGVFPLAESQLDRFLIKAEVGYASEEDEVAMLRVPHRGVVTDVIGDVFPFLGDSAILQIQDLVDATETGDAIERAVVAIVRRTRELPGVSLGASPRAAVHLLAAAKARAALHGRRRVELDDVAGVAPLVLAHRLQADRAPDGVVREALERALA